MNLEDMHKELGRLLAIEVEHAEFRQSLAVAQAEVKTLTRKLAATEKSLKGERAKQTTPLMTAEHERWLFSRTATLEFGATQRGQFKVKLKTGRRGDGRPTELLFDPPKSSNPMRAVRAAIEKHQAR